MAADRFESESERQAVETRYENLVRPFFARGRGGSFAATGGLTLRYLFLPAGSPAGSPAGTLVILPGKGEPYLKYAELLHDLSSLDLDLYALDHRGMGYSDRLLPDRRKVHVERFDHYVADVVRFVEEIVRPRAPGRIALLGHSTGGVVAARLLQEHPGLIDAAILTSPAFVPRLGPLPGWLARLVARGMDRPGRGQEYAPGEERKVQTPFERNRITHSRARWERWEERIPREHPSVVVGGVTRRWLRELTEAGRQAVQGAAAVRTPVLLLQAGDDRVVRIPPQERFCRRCQTCTLVRLEGARHEIPIEADAIRAPALEAIGQFLQSHLSGGP